MKKHEREMVYILAGGLGFPILVGVVLGTSAAWWTGAFICAPLIIGIAVGVGVFGGRR